MRYEASRIDLTMFDFACLWCGCMFGFCVVDCFVDGVFVLLHYCKSTFVEVIGEVAKWRFVTEM